MKNVERLEELAGVIFKQSGEHALEHSKALSGNKAAAARARKATLALEKACKEYRKLSVEASKS